MLDLAHGILDFGEGDCLAVDGPLAAFQASRAYARLSPHPNPHVPGLLALHGWQETVEAWQLAVTLSFYQGRGAGIAVQLRNGPLSPFDWARISESLLTQEIRVLAGVAQALLGRAADRPTFAHAPDFGATWELPWGQLSAHGEPRSYTAGLYLTPRHRIGKAYSD